MSSEADEQIERVMRDVGHRMRTLRMRAERTQDYIADRLDVQQATVSKWESGKLPTLRTLAKYAEAIGVTLDDLLEPALSAPATLAERVAEMHRTLQRIERALPLPQEGRQEADLAGSVGHGA